jgi:hypothetical protein
MKESKAPALEHTFKLFHEIKDRGFKIILVSSRKETLRSSTVDNLIKVGYHGWKSLMLRYVTCSSSLNQKKKEIDFVDKSFDYIYHERVSLLCINYIYIITGVLKMNLWKCKGTNPRWGKSWLMKGIAFGALLEISGAVLRGLPVQKGHSNYPIPFTIEV